MITLVNIKTAIIQLLKKQFGLKCYGKDTLQGFDKPCFFVELIPHSSNTMDRQSKNDISIIITYLQETISEIDSLQKYDSIKELFGNKLHVENRYLNIDENTCDFVGKDNNIMQATIVVSYLDYMPDMTTYETINKVNINERMMK